MRVPRKNIRKIGGTKLFEYSIRAALAARLINSVYVTSDSKKILEDAESIGAKSIKRPLHLSKSDVEMLPVLIHALERIVITSGVKPDIIVLLQPTHPFRDPFEIDNIISDLINDNSVSSIITVREEAGLQGIIIENKFVPDVRIPRDRSTETKKFINTGTVYGLKVSETLDKGSFFGNNIRAHLLNKPNIEIDIDWPLDLAQARTIARFFKKDLVKIGIIKKGLT